MKPLSCTFQPNRVTLPINPLTPHNKALHRMTAPDSRSSRPITRFTLRAILAQFAAIAVIATTAAVGTVAFINARATVERLSSEVFEMEADYTNARVIEYSSSARHILALNSALLGDGHVDTNELRALGGHFIDVIRANPRLSSSGFGNPRGEAMWVTSDPSGQVRVHAYRLNGDEQMTRVSYLVTAGDNWELEIEEDSEYNGTVRPWYKAALSSTEREAVWSDPYLFIPEYVPGISLTQQVHSPSGDLLGVTFVDFEFRFLSRALQELHTDRPGAQSIIFDEAGTVLAHTNPDTTSREDENGEMHMVTLGEHAEPLVRRLATDLGLPAQAGQPHTKGLQHVTENGVRYVVIVHTANLLQERTRLRWSVAVMVPEALILEGVRRQGLYSVVIGFAIFMTFLVTRSSSRRVTNSFYGFFDELQRLGDLDLREPKRKQTRISEVHTLGHNLDQMRNGLRSFGRYVSAALVRELISKGIEARPGGHDQEVTILFTDVVGFTTISEGLDPQPLAEKLSHNLEEASLIVDHHQGTVDKYIGDSVMAFWNAPNPVPDHAVQACHAALEILAKIDASRSDAQPLWPIRIGINTTVALVGNLGSLSRLDYTVIGDGVNLASRIEGINKQYGTRVLIGETTKQAVETTFLTRPIDHVIVKGQSRPEPIHELMALRAKASAIQQQLAAQTEAALALFLAERWSDARSAYLACLEISPGDAPAERFVARCDAKLAESTT